MRVSLHSLQEQQLIKLCEELGLNPTGLIKLLITQAYTNMIKGDRPVLEAHLYGTKETT